MILNHPDHSRQGEGRAGRSAAARLKDRFGQSLVEFALVLPILLLIVAGILEVGNVLAIYTRLQNAARDGARQAAAGSPDKTIADLVSGELAGLRESPNQKQIWVIRPVHTTAGWDNDTDTMNTKADPDWGVEPVCVYGPVPPCPGGTGATASPPLNATTILNNLRTYQGTNSTLVSSSDNGEVRFVIVAIYYEADTLLNLSFLPLANAQGRIPMTVYAFLKQEVSQSAVDALVGGCSAYNIALNASTLTRNNTLQPAANDRITFTQFANPYQFEYVIWQPGQSADIAGAGLAVPGNSTSATDGYNSYPEESPEDRALNVGDYVLRYSGIPNNANAAISSHISSRRTLRVIVFDSRRDLVGNEGFLPGLRISGFAIVRLLSGSTLAQLNVEFLKYETNCGLPDNVVGP